MGKFILLFLLLPCSIYSQKGSNYKIGDISAKDFNINYSKIDSSADAVIISDIGYTKLQGSGKGWFALVFKHYRKAYIKNKNAFDLASVSIPLFKNEEGEVKLEKLRGATYNLVDGKLVESKLDTKDGVFEEKTSKSSYLKKFTLLNIKEGCIIEYEITTVSDFIVYPEAWEFQGAYPRIYSEYRITVPNFLYYVMHTQGYFNYDEEKREDGFSSYNIRNVNDVNQTQTTTVNAGVATYSWVLKNAPAIRNESFTASPNNHIQKIGFQLSETREPLDFRQIIESWPQVTNKMLTSNDFGLILKVDRNWMNQITEPMRKESSSKLELAKKIYYYVNSSVNCTDHSGISLTKTLREVVKSQSGNVAEINALLVSILTHEGIEADPVIQSTRDNGLILIEEPVLTNFNYLICRAKIDGKTYYLDASHPGLGFGYLSLQSYNGRARVINEKADQVFFYADALRENRKTLIELQASENGFKGNYKRQEAYYASLDIRKTIHAKGKEEWLKTLYQGTEGIKLSSLQIDSLDKTEFPVSFKMNISLDRDEGDVIYFDPVILEGIKQHPFPAPTRYYPVEMPYGIDYDYELRLNAPAGYVLEEIPKDISVVLQRKEDGLFEYKTSQKDGMITIHYRLFVRRANYEPNEYKVLRDFFTEVVKKQNEQLVFRKKK